ncbi:MAG TPA: VOC family protein [Thermoplasmata archaeon]|nr:VOC family protein [Thermoplasmata archaeon]
MRPTRSPGLAPYLVVQDATGLMEFIDKGLGGSVGFVTAGAGGRPIHHAEMLLGGGVVMLADAPEGRGAFPAMVHLYVPDAEGAHDRAVRAGAQSVRRPTLQDDGDRRGGVRDAWGNEWWFTQSPKSKD